MSVNADPLELHMLSLINAERTARGLNELELETNLNMSAEEHSQWMLQTNTFSHTGEGGSSATDRIRAELDLTGSWRTAENIAIQSIRGEPGLFDDVEDLHLALMNSPGHRANLLNPNLEYIGLGIELDEFTYSGGATLESLVVTQNFATTAAMVDLDPGVNPAPVEPPPAPEPDPVPDPDVVADMDPAPEDEEPVAEAPPPAEPEEVDEEDTVVMQPPAAPAPMEPEAPVEEDTVAEMDPEPMDPVDAQDEGDDADEDDEVVAETPTPAEPEDADEDETSVAEAPAPEPEEEEDVTVVETPAPMAPEDMDEDDDMTVAETPVPDEVPNDEDADEDTVAETPDPAPMEPVEAQEEDDDEDVVVTEAPEDAEEDAEEDLPIAEAPAEDVPVTEDVVFDDYACPFPSFFDDAPLRGFGRFEFAGNRFGRTDTDNGFGDFNLANLFETVFDRVFDRISDRFEIAQDDSDDIDDLGEFDNGGFAFSLNVRGSFRGRDRFEDDTDSFDSFADRDFGDFANRASIEVSVDFFS